MGLDYKIVSIEQKELDAVSCDKCGVAIRKHCEGHWNEYGEPHTKYHKPLFDSFFLLEHRWGFSSTKDGEDHSAVLCEACYDEVFKNVKISITRYF